MLGPEGSDDNQVTEAFFHRQWYDILEDYYS